MTLGAQFVVSGEIEGDTGAMALYVGLRLLAEAGAGLPVHIDNMYFQVVPSYQVRAGFSVNF